MRDERDLDEEFFNILFDSLFLLFLEKKLLFFSNKNPKKNSTYNNT
jgi:hypothetical protein